MGDEPAPTQLDRVDLAILDEALDHAAGDGELLGGLRDVVEKACSHATPPSITVSA